MKTAHNASVGGRRLLLNVRAGFVAQGSSLHRWCRENGIPRQNAEKALMGIWKGPGARRLYARLLAAASIDPGTLRYSGTPIVPANGAAGVEGDDAEGAGSPR